MLPKEITHHTRITKLFTNINVLRGAQTRINHVATAIANCLDLVATSLPVLKTSLKNNNNITEQPTKVAKNQTVFIKRC